MNRQPSSLATAPIARIASKRAWVNRAWVSSPRKRRVIPRCQSLVWRNLVMPPMAPAGFARLAPTFNKAERVQRHPAYRTETPFRLRPPSGVEGQVWIEYRVLWNKEAESPA
jgi:hypothetical protein